MCNGIVLDSVSVTIYQKQRVLNRGGPAVEALDNFLSDGVILMDTGGIMINEWLQTANFSSHARDNLKDWIADQYAKGRIKMRKLTADQQLMKEFGNLGVFGRDRKYLMIACQGNAYAVISDDPDMYDPKLKNKATRTRIKAIMQRKGKVCSFVKKKFGLEIGPIEQVADIVPQCDNL